MPLKGLSCKKAAAQRARAGKLENKSMPSTPVMASSDDTTLLKQTTCPSTKIVLWFGQSSSRVIVRSVVMRGLWRAGLMCQTKKILFLMSKWALAIQMKNSWNMMKKSWRALNSNSEKPVKMKNSSHWRIGKSWRQTKAWDMISDAKAQLGSPTAQPKCQGRFFGPWATLSQLSQQKNSTEGWVYFYWHYWCPTLLFTLLR